tara:strand:- start:7 stop:714 length:708 start_codon:yes stop_codon:yes gene_type:complete
MLKVELHTHCNIDPHDKPWVKYSPKRLVDEAIKKKFDVLAITCHNLMYENHELKKYAEKKGLLLIFGVERDVEGKHVLIYNITQNEANKIKTFSDLAELKKKNKIFTIAAHPFYPTNTCLQKNVIKHLDLFDAWEYSFFHSWFYNPNKKLIKLAKRYNKPIVGNSDVHVLKDLGRTYSLINARKNEQEIFEAIMEKKVKIVTRPLSTLEFLHCFSKVILSQIRKRLKIYIQQFVL